MDNNSQRQSKGHTPYMWKHIYNPSIHHPLSPPYFPSLFLALGAFLSLLAHIYYIIGYNFSMTSTPSSSITRTKKPGPLHFLAYVALDTERHPYDSNVSPEPPGQGMQNAAGPSYETPPYTISSSPTQSVSSLHISCGRSPSDAGSEPRPLLRSTSSNSSQRAESTPVQSKHPMRTRRKCHARESPLHIKAKEETLARRRERLERATKIRSLDNSPVNDEQLTVLRMVYDEITMYPSESWMVLIAIIIRR
jgi:hypothetical protein